MAPRDYSIKDLEKVLETDGKVKSVEVTRLTPPGENYSSLVLKADFNVEKNGHITKISTVAKRVPMTSEEFMLNRALKSQENEIIFYREIVPFLLNFAKEYGLYNEANLYPGFCGARYSLDKSKTKADAESVILLENLVVKGYDVLDRYIGFDLESSKVVLKKLAAFHAIPIVMKLKNPEAFKTMVDYFEASKEEHHGPPPSFKKGPRVNHIWNAIQEMPECAPYVSRLEPVVTRPMMGPAPSADNRREPWVTITHNDYWGNNILIKFNKDKEPSIILLDHARSTYDSFAKDLLFFLLTSVQNEFQGEYMDDLLRVYYDEFTRLLRHCNVSPILSFDEYMNEVNFVAKQSEVGHALGFSNIIFGSKNPQTDYLTGEGNLFDQIAESSKYMNQYQKNKIVSIASVAARRNWI